MADLTFSFVLLLLISDLAAFDDLTTNDLGFADVGFEAVVDLLFLDLLVEDFDFECLSFSDFEVALTDLADFSATGFDLGFDGLLLFGFFFSDFLCFADFRLPDLDLIFDVAFLLEVDDLEDFEVEPFMEAPMLALESFDVRLPFLSLVRVDPLE